jgi:hypothetical protein
MYRKNRFVQGIRGVRVAYEVYLIDQTMTFTAALEAAHCTLPSGSKHVNRGDLALIDFFSFPSTILSSLFKTHDG